MSEPVLVALCGSAGALQPLKQFFACTPLDHACYIILHHFPIDQQSRLTDILEPYTRLTLRIATEGAPLRGNVVYVEPMGTYITIDQDRIRLVNRNERSNRSIDTFLASLSAAVATRTIAILLSNSGTDGLAGARRLKSLGGHVFAQAPETADHRGILYNAEELEIIDEVLSPAELPKAVSTYAASIMK